MKFIKYNKDKILVEILFHYFNYNYKYFFSKIKIIFNNKINKLLRVMRF